MAVPGVCQALAKLSQRLRLGFVSAARGLRTGRRGGRGQQKGKSRSQFTCELNLFPLSRREPIPAASRGAGLAPCHLPGVDSVYIYVCVYFFFI